jgi:hypothetical protein
MTGKARQQAPQVQSQRRRSFLPPKGGPHNTRLEVLVAIDELVAALQKLNAAPGETVDGCVVDFHLASAKRRIREAIRCNLELDGTGRNSIPKERTTDDAD